jgi:hypothetical protein
MWIALPLALLAANPYLDEARKLADSLHYPEAEAKLRTASRVPTNSPEERREIVDLLARAVVAQGRAAEAESLYAEWLAGDPDATPPVGVAPKIRDAFVKAKQRVFPPDFARLEQLPAPNGRLAFKLVDPWRRVSQVVLSEREGTAPFVPHALTPRGRLYGVDLPVLTPGARHELYLEALSDEGRALATVGSASQPLTFSAPAAPPAPLAATAVAPPPEPAGPPRWPKWVAGTLAVAAAGTAAGFGVSAARDSNAAGSPSAPAAQVRALDASARQKAIVANACGAGALVAGAGAVVLAWKW